MIRLRCPRAATVFLASTLTIALSTDSSAETAVLPVLADTTLNESAPGNNMGGNSQILAGTDGSGRLRRGLLSFGLASEIPAGAIINSATLYLTATSANPAASDFHLHRVLVGWSEGTGSGATGAPALPGDATWNSRLHGTSLWSAAGGLSGADYVAASSSTTNVSAAGEYAFTGLAADVQFMLDNPGSNFGWMFISGREGTPQTARQFIAGELGGATIPRLEVEYSVIPEPGALSLALIGFSVASGWIRRKKNARGAEAVRSPSRTDLKSVPRGSDLMPTASA